MQKLIKRGMTINQITDIHQQWVADMGWLNKTPLECLALIASEVGEAVNECRGDKPTSRLGSELADIILRSMGLASQEGIDIDHEIVSKMVTNAANGNIKNRLK